MAKRPLVLVADDSHSVAVRLTELFEAKGCDVIHAVDGIDCIKQVFRCWPAFVVLDVNMPKLNGYQACRFLKNHPATADIPVMLLTALDKPIDELWGYETGADYYRSKSSNSESIVTEVAEAIKARPVSPAGEECEITEGDILGFVNEILDARLFELTLISEITSLSYEINEISELVNRCAGFLGRMLPIYMVGFALPHERRVPLYLWSSYEYGPHVDDMQAYARSVLANQGYAELHPVFTFGIERIPGAYYEKKEFVHVDHTIHATPDQGSHPVTGSIFICLNRDDVRALDRMHSLLNHMLLVINNCMLYRKVLDLSMTDELTGLFNRRKIFELLRNEMERSSRYNYELAVIMADIDNFKKINDTYGHATGDIVLKKVAAVMNSSLRKVDSVGRIGGEEFLIVSPQTSESNAVTLAERIRRMLSVMKIENMKEHVTLSFGVSVFTQGKGMDALINEADMALYDAKRSGKDRVRCCARKL